MLPMTEAILAELRNELRVATTDEFHQGTPVLGRLLGVVAHELDMLVQLHDKLQRAGTTEVSIIPAMGFAQAIVALGSSIDMILDIMCGEYSPLPNDVFVTLGRQVESLVTAYYSLTGADLDDEVLTRYREIKKEINVRAERARTGSDVQADGGHQPAGSGGH